MPVRRSCENNTKNNIGRTLTLVCLAFFDQTQFYQKLVAMYMRLLKSHFLTVPGSAILQYGGYYGGCMVKSLIRYKYSFFKLLKSKNEWHQWKERKRYGGLKIMKSAESALF